MRSFAVLLLVALAACPASNDASPADLGDSGLGSGHGAGNAKSSCRADADCSPAAATCCDCPAFAVNRNDPTHRACDGISCPGKTTCPNNVRAVCDAAGFCALACVPTVCTETCAAGYTIDPTGCLSCACAVPDPGGCAADVDCVETRADCCGCARGGADTATRAAEQPAFDAMLGCPSDPTCPAVNVCTPDAAPRCVQGRCELTTGTLPPGACGRGDLPPCPAGEVCTVNTSDAASMLGVGVCVRP